MTALEVGTLLTFLIIQIFFLFIDIKKNRCGGVEVECSPRMREIGVRSAVRTDIVVKTGSYSSPFKRSKTVPMVLGDNHY